MCQQEQFKMVYCLPQHLSDGHRTYKYWWNNIKLTCSESLHRLSAWCLNQIQSTWMLFSKTSCDFKYKLIFQQIMSEEVAVFSQMLLLRQMPWTQSIAPSVWPVFLNIKYFEEKGLLHLQKETSREGSKLFNRYN